jgi:hypothetical protein
MTDLPPDVDKALAQAATGRGIRKATYAHPDCRCVRRREDMGLKVTDASKRKCPVHGPNPRDRKPPIETAEMFDPEPYRKR